MAFGPAGANPIQILDGQHVAGIQTDLTSATDQTSAGDLTVALPLKANEGAAYAGIQKTGPFDIHGSLARQWLSAPNPDGRANSEVVRPWFNGLDITRRPRDMWIIDFGVNMAQEEAALFEAPFAYAQTHVK
ncbi:class I SAM-dependent DNA methyltransferase, partial [bacterium]|nr:class I SAM-dependent DNA methyltransferase [bacterium]